MPRGLPQTVKDNIDKCRWSAIAAVDAYNRAGLRFRTPQFIVLITIAWTALFHAIFYRRGRRPWYRKTGPRVGVRYVKVDGEPKHWELIERLKQFYLDLHPAERKNLESLLVQGFGQKYALAEQLAVSLRSLRFFRRKKPGQIRPWRQVPPRP